MNLPTEIWGVIISYLELKDAIKMRIVCKTIIVYPYVSEINLGKYPYNSCMELMCGVTKLTARDGKYVHLNTPNLTYLNVCNNSDVCISLVAFTKLKSLICGFTQISDDDLTSLVSLTALDAYSSNLNGKCFKTLTNITALDITDTDIRVSDIQHLSLKRLAVYDCEEELSAFTNLQVLEIGDYNHGKSIRGLTSLTALALDYNSGVTNQDIRGLTNLRTLNLEQNTCIGNISSLTALTSLNLRNSIDIDVSMLTNLTELNICGCICEGVSLLTNLTLLNIDGMLIMRNDISMLTNLTALRLSGSQFNNNTISAMTKLLYLDCNGSAIDDVSCLPLLRKISDQLTIDRKLMPEIWLNQKDFHW